MRNKKLRKFDVAVPSGGIFKTISVTARTNYLAKIEAGKKLGILKPGSRRYRFTNRTHIKRRNANE